MRPQFEYVKQAADASWILHSRDLPSIPFEWHYHPEYELTLTLNGRGQRFVGDDISDFDDGDLVLIGPNLPHTWSAPAIDAQRPTRSIVMWFSQAWVDGLVADFPELQPLHRLARSAAQGLEFSAAHATALRPLIEGLLQATPARRLPTLLEILVRLTEDPAPRCLSLGQLEPPRLAAVQGERLARVLDLLHADFAQPIEIAPLAERAAMTVGAFHRFFRRHMQMTVTAYVARLRIGRACQQLVETTKPVAVIASELGFASLSHFNRQFRELRGMTPRAFRTRHEQRP
ncbi:AraC family transcriptional regulator [Niveibacterium sp. SC-1]|uniref:AraC family transcriptional regulator n=1 Tax=Niveibacterium sp. SC-1 TaxID=3135646 RepID=UPI00311FE81B